MKITLPYIGYSGVHYTFEYEDADSFDHLPYDSCRQTYAVCFCEGKIVIVLHGRKGHWGLVGGTIEKGETFEQTLKREIQEESNLEMLSCLPIGYQKVIDSRDGSFFYQLRYVATAKSFGPFVVDPAGDITEVKFIDIDDYKQYFDWKEIGDRVIERAKELVGKM
ncbi:MAG: hypothetical protein RL641_710 [Candidatus Parcubacteria bacterium]|jgi:8-oxo-dGTP pyrophosphatase MutT (NUDIX family)